MRIAVVGAGAVGGTLAALLVRAGHYVDVAARGANLAAIQAGGIRLDGGWGEYTAQVAASERLVRRPELTILATKAQDSAAAIADNRAMIDSSPLLVVQNGLGRLDLLHHALATAPIVGGTALFAASYLTPGHVTVTSALPLIVGPGPETDAAMFAMVADTLAAALPVERTSDIRGVQWTKLVVNHLNALPAITGMNVQDVVANHDLRRVLIASMRETIRVGRQTGVRFGSVQGLSGRLLNLVGAAPLAVGQLFPQLLTWRMGTVPIPGSTLQSIQRGQLSEIDFLNGAIVGWAIEHGLTAPTNAAIVALVHEVERSGRFLTPEQLRSRVPLRGSG